MAKNKDLESKKKLSEQPVEPSLQSVKQSNNFKTNTLELQKTPQLNKLTKYEIARILGTRAAQIQNGMPPVFFRNGEVVGLPDEFKDNVNSSIDIAMLELKLGSTPLVIERQLPSGRINNITVQELQ